MLAAAVTYFAHACRAPCRDGTRAAWIQPAVLRRHRCSAHVAGHQRQQMLRACVALAPC